MSEIESYVGALQQAYQGAVYDKAVESFMRLYDPAVRIFDTWGVWEYPDAASWRRSVTAWLTSLGDERVKVSFEDTRSGGSTDFCFASAVTTYAAVSPAGKTLRSMQNRLTWTIRVDGESPVILHEHTSAPIGFDDMKAILRRSPRPA